MDAVQDAVLSQFDQLTGLATREFYQSRIAEAWEQSVLEKNVMALMLVAIDGMDRDSDVDAALRPKLRDLAAVLSDACKRRSDFAARMRAAEFAVYLAEVDADGCMTQGKVICEEVRKRTALSVSVGVACFLPRGSHFVRSLYQYADQALQDARAAGGNQVRVMTGSDF